ncbi:hypothetical protein CK203_061870 [Vitis vinifera]|uniref:Uncharacterized protein n=1 Tax=Vitis vinifera TaxID=29760 RepID=A0A438G761_VITVI|nr:hypothetical protein CK203_061870 [Vitis vinifera]
MSMSKNAWVSEVWNPVGDGIGWTPLFARAFNDWEIDLVERLLQKIQAFREQLQRRGFSWQTGAFSVCLKKNSGSSLTALYQDAGPMEPSFLSFWYILDSLVYSEDNPSGWNGGLWEKDARRLDKWRVMVPSRESFFSCKFCRLDRLLVRKGGVYTPCLCLSNLMVYHAASSRFP